jgi:hypothetical protein
MKRDGSFAEEDENQPFHFNLKLKRSRNQEDVECALFFQVIIWRKFLKTRVARFFCAKNLRAEFWRKLIINMCAFFARKFYAQKKRAEI